MTRDTSPTHATTWTKKLLDFMAEILIHTIDEISFPLLNALLLLSFFFGKTHISFASGLSLKHHICKNAINEIKLNLELSSLNYTIKILQGQINFNATLKYYWYA